MKTLNNTQAVLISAALFICLFFLLTLGSNYLANNSQNFVVYLHWLNFVAYVLYILGGFVAGILLKQNKIIVGLVAGLISAVSAILMFGVAHEAFGIFATLVSGLVLGGIGGGLSLLFKRKFTNAL